MKLKKYSSYFLIVLVIVFLYWDLSKTFFQQDEWKLFAEILYFKSKSGADMLQYFFPADAISHFNPLALVYDWIVFAISRISFQPRAYLSIVFHILNSILLFEFVGMLTKKKKIGFLSSLIFAVSYIPSQAVTWIASTDSYEIPTIFILLSLIFFYRFLQSSGDKRSLFASFLSLFISFLFHENGIFLLVLYPVLFWVYKGKEKKLKSLFVKAVAGLVLIFLLVRLPLLFVKAPPLPQTTDISRPPLLVYPYRVLSISMKSYGESIFPETTLIGFSDQLTKIAYPQFVTGGSPSPFISQSIVFDISTYSFSAGILFLLFLLYRKIKNEEEKKALIFGVLFLPLSLWSYAFVLGQAGYASILTPKYFYITNIAVSLIIAVVFWYFVELFSKRKWVKAFLFVLLGIYIIWNMYAVRSAISGLVTIGMQRKNFLVSIESSYPKLPQKTIVYTESDIAYYGMPSDQPILPVEVGFGKMLMIWYQDKEHFSGCFFEGNFLLPLLSQGYESCGGRGFGYFRNYQLMKETIVKNHLPSTSVIAYSWNGENQEFTDITTQIRSRLSKELLYEK